MSTVLGKSALVTGASRGIGREVALTLARGGGHVLIHYGSSEKEADALVAEIHSIGGVAQKVGADLRQPDGPHLLARQVRAIIGDRLDILVANAGVSKSASLADTSIEDFDRLFAVNVRAPFFLVQQLLPAFRQGSSIVFTSSLAGAGFGGYVVCLCGDEGRDQYPGHALRCCASGRRESASMRWHRVSSRTDMSNFARTESGRATALSMQALKRVAQPSDIAPVVAFLASDDARWITGDIIEVDGGSKL